MSVYVVSTTGSDGAAGGEGAPWRTIKHGISQLRPGDELLIRGGEYNEENVNIAICGTEQAPVTVRAYESEPVTWNVTGSNTLLYTAAGAWWTFDGLTLTERLILGDGWAEYADGWTFRNCLFVGSRLGGIWAKYTNRMTLDGCEFHDIRSGQAGEDVNALNLSLLATNTVVSGCDFSGIGSDGIHIGGYSNSVATDILIDDCVFLGEQGTGENAIDVKNAHDVLIQNCIVSGFRSTVPGQDASGAQGEGINLIAVGGNGTPCASRVRIEQCWFRDNEIHLWISRGVQDIELINNLFDNPVETSEENSGSSLVMYNAGNVAMLHNTFLGGRYHVRGYADQPTTGVMRNNAFTGGGFYVPSPGHGWEFEADHNAWDGGELPAIFRGEGDIAGDLGVNEQGQPHDGSPLIWAGVDVGVEDDFAGERRSETPTIGAYEYEEENLMGAVNEIIAKANQAETLAAEIGAQMAAFQVLMAEIKAAAETMEEADALADQLAEKL